MNANGEKSGATMMGSFNKMDNDVEWSDSIEQLLQRYADEAIIREALHRRSYYKYKKLTTCFQLPVIILSALSGSFTFIASKYPSIENIIITSTGSVSILVSIISAVYSYLKLGETMSKHEVAEVAWQSFLNKIKHELNLRRDIRTEAGTFIEEVKLIYERLFELSPIVNQSIINKTKIKIRAIDHELFNIPNYMNGFTATTVFQEMD